MALVAGVAVPASAAPTPAPAAPAAPAAAAPSDRARPVVAGAPVKPRALDVGGVPRQQPAPVGRAMPAASRARELVGRRTATGSYYELSDGRTEAELSAAPVHYRDARGAVRAGGAGGGPGLPGHAAGVEGRDRAGRGAAGPDVHVHGGGRRVAGQAAGGRVDRALAGQRGGRAAVCDAAPVHDRRGG